jgi:hypothetical protein
VAFHTRFCGVICRAAFEQPEELFHHDLYPRTDEMRAGE